MKELRVVWYRPRRFDNDGTHVHRQETAPKSLEDIREGGLVPQIGQFEDGNLVKFARMTQANIAKVRGTEAGHWLWLCRQDLHTRMNSVSNRVTDFERPFSIDGRNEKDTKKLAEEAQACYAEFGYVVDDPKHHRRGEGHPVRCRKRRT